MFELSEEHRMLQELVAKFVDRELIPLEKAVLAREMSGQKSALSAEEEATLLGKCRELGLCAARPTHSLFHRKRLHFARQ